jgi:hypothetical protein
MARLSERRDILTPIGLVKIHCQEVAGVIWKQWVNADNNLSGQVLVEHLIGQWQQLPV